MDLVPYYGEQPLTVSKITVQVRASDQQHAEELVKRAIAEVRIVKDEPTYTQARRVAAELKAYEKEIHESKRAAKRPFEAVLAAIEDRAKEFSLKVTNEEKRVLDLMTGYVRQLEEEKKAVERKLREKLEREEKEHQRRMAEMRIEKEKAEAAARAAQDELERRKASEEAKKREEALQQAETLRNLEVEVRAMTMEPLKGVVPGGRVTHPRTFKLRNAEETVKAGCIRLLRIEVDVRACQDSVNSQLEIAPDQEPSLPGIEISQETKVQVKAASRIS